MLKRWYFQAIASRSLRRVSAVVACSHNDQRMFEPIADRVQLIENAVRIPYALELSRKRANRFLYVGRLAPNKEVPNLLNAWAVASRQRPGLELHLAGPDTDGQLGSYERLLNKLGIQSSAKFLGNIDDDSLIREFREASVFVSASSQEGFGLSAVEAMGYGCIPLLNRNSAFTRLLVDQFPRLPYRLCKLSFSGTANRPTC